MPLLTSIEIGGLPVLIKNVYVFLDKLFIEFTSFDLHLQIILASFFSNLGGQTRFFAALIS